jgi:branched-subunit amino acid transport protein AzlD
MSALLEARPPSLTDRIDLVRGAFDAHLRGADPEASGGIAAALLAGGAWTIVGVASIGGPTPPDWPGYLDSTLPIALLGAVAVLVATLRLARLAWASSGLTLELAAIAAVVGHLAWAGALVVAIFDGPYGAITAIAQSMAAISTVGMGLVLLRARAHPVGEAMVVAGAVLLVPTPAAWLAIGALWTGIGVWRSVVDARSGDSPSAAPG